MKKLLFYFFIFSSAITVAQTAQNTSKKRSSELPVSLLNLDFLFESEANPAAYPGLGVKMVFGSQNTGILAGFSVASDNYSQSYRSIRAGYQYGIKRGLYSNVNLNLLNFRYDGYYYSGYPSADIIENHFRLNLGLGYTLSLGKKKRFYINLEGACALINTNDELSRIILNFGYGFRFGTPAKTSYEGVKNVTTVPIKP
jgi:hypothetical protein